VKEHQLVFLTGLHRSGTTLLARLLAAHPRCDAGLHPDWVHVLRYEQLVRDPSGAPRGILEFLEHEPIPPSEPVESGENETYFGQWRDIQRDPRMRAYLDLVSLWYERRRARYMTSTIGKRVSTSRQAAAKSAVPTSPVKSE